MISRNTWRKIHNAKGDEIFSTTERMAIAAELAELAQLRSNLPLVGEDVPKVAKEGPIEPEFARLCPSDRALVKWDFQQRWFKCTKCPRAYTWAEIAYANVNQLDENGIAKG